MILLSVGGDARISSFPQECLAARLRELNEGAVTHFRQNLNHYDETLGEVQNLKPWILPTFTIFIAVKCEETPIKNKLDVVMVV